MWGCSCPRKSRPPRSRRLPVSLVALLAAGLRFGAAQARERAARCAAAGANGDDAAYRSVVDMRLVGHDDLQARSAYQPIVHAYGERRILFVGHHAGEAPNPLTGKVEKNGLSILDVTDPAAPKYLAHVPPTGPDASGTQHVQVCDGSALPRVDGRGRRSREGLRDSHQRPVELRGARRHRPEPPDVRHDHRRDRHVVAPEVGSRRPRDAQVPVGLRDRHRVSQRHAAGLARDARAPGVRSRGPDQTQAHPRFRPRRLRARRGRRRTRSRRSRACTSRPSSAAGCTWATTAATTACCRSSIATSS